MSAASDLGTDLAPSLMVVSTGEVVAPMTTEEASSITTRINVKLDAIADNYESVMPMIREAITRRAHLALDYKSPGAYVADRFGHALKRLAPATRQQVVRELTDAGLSTRAIAPVVGVSQKTVSRDAGRDAGESHDSPDEAQSVANDLAEQDPEFARRAAESQAADDDEPLTDAECEELERQRTGAPKPTTGLDGKTYPNKSKAAKPRQKPLPEVASTLGWDMRKTADRLTAVVEDGRYAANEKQVARLNDLVNLPGGSPILALRSRLQQISDDRMNVSNEELFTLVIRAWNAWRSRRSISSLPLRHKGQPFRCPEPK